MAVTMFQTLRRVMTDNGSTLKIRCGRCGHIRGWSREEALRRFGPDAAPYDIRRRAYCGVCQERNNLVVFI